MERIIKAAIVTATTDRGEFTAIAAAYSLDRAGDEIIPGAFGKTIAKWQASGKQIPLHWNHSGAAADIIGSVDPASIQEVDGLGLQVAGKVDIAGSETAKEAWRSMKNGSMSLSFGYMVVKATKRKDGVQELHELDLFEISIVPVPANPDTKILSMKGGASTSVEKFNEYPRTTTGVGGVGGPLPKEERAAALRKQADEVALSAALGFQEPPAVPQEDTKSAVEETVEQLKEMLEQLNKELPVKVKLAVEKALEDQKKADAMEKGPHARSVDPLRKQAEDTALAVALGFERPPTPERREPTPEPELDLKELRKQARDRMLQILSGVEET